MNIRTATKADLVQIFQLEQAAFGEHCYPDFLFRQWLDLSPSLLLVAESESIDEVACIERNCAFLGYVVGSLAEVKAQGWVLSLAVTESARGKGVGKALLEQFIARATSLGCEQLRLTVHPDNRALYLYHSCGFCFESAEADYFGPDAPRQVLLRVKPSEE